MAWIFMISPSSAASGCSCATAPTLIAQANTAIANFMLFSLPLWWKLGLIRVYPRSSAAKFSAEFLRNLLWHRNRNRQKALHLALVVAQNAQRHQAFVPASVFSQEGPNVLFRFAGKERTADHALASRPHRHAIQFAQLLGMSLHVLRIHERNTFHLAHDVFGLVTREVLRAFAEHADYAIHAGHDDGDVRILENRLHQPAVIECGYGHDAVSQFSSRRYYSLIPTHASASGKKHLTYGELIANISKQPEAKSSGGVNPFKIKDRGLKAFKLKDLAWASAVTS